jgi:hypothetical protein
MSCPSSCWFLVWRTFQPWRWRQHVPPRLQLIFDGLHGIISKKIRVLHNHHREVLTSSVHILYNVTGYLITSEHPLYRVTLLKTPFGLLIPFITIPITRNYIHSIISYAVPHLRSLQSYTFVTTITYYTLTLADFSAINYCLKLS